MMEFVNNQNVAVLLNTLFHSTDLGRLINCSAELLENPLSVYGTDYCALAYSAFDGINDVLWTSGKAGKSCLYEYAAILHRVEASYMQNPDRVICLDVDNFGNHRRRVIPLIFNTQVVGFLSVLEYYKPFNDISSDLYDFAAGVLTKEVVAENGTGRCQYGRSAEAILSDLLNGAFAAKELFSQRIQGTELAQSAYYRAVSIDMENVRFGNPKRTNLREILNALFPQAWSVLFENRIILLACCGKGEEIPEPAVKRLRSLLADNGLSAGISDGFRELYELKKYCRQAFIAARMAQMLRRKDVISWFDDYKLWYCVSVAYKRDKDACISTFVKKLAEYDRENKSEYVRTLYYYLDVGKNAAKAASAMHVHKNTVIYRLERMKSLFPAASGSGYEDMQNYLSCMLVMLEERDALLPESLFSA